MDPGGGCVAVIAFAVPAAASRRVAQPRFLEVSAVQQQRFLARVDRTPPPLRRLVHRAYPHLRVRLSRTKLGGEGNHTATLIGAGPMRFVVALTHARSGAGHTVAT